MPDAANFVVSAAVGLCGSGVGLAAFNAVFNRGGQRAEAAAKRAEGAKTEVEAAVSKHATWRADFEKNYEILEKRCDQCDEKLDRFEDALYGMFDELEEQVAPMLLLPNTNPMETLAAMRACVRRARNTIREPAG
jgi:DNA repair exonuclease SbcCD ATPase subunit